jgi:tetratricopeptide (TPR) repeat protein
VADAGVGAVLAAARSLMLAGQWENAGRLLAATATADPAERALLALARAQAAVEIRQWRGTGDPAPALAEAGTLIAGSGPPGAALDLDLLRLFADYWAELMPAGGRPPGFGPDGRDPAVLAGLSQRAEALLDVAPDPRREARAAFFAGLVADNLCGEHAKAVALFGRALAVCRPGEDDDLASEALRHLGGAAQEAGDLPLARQQWERSAELAERAGWVLLSLAQQALLAELAGQQGDAAGAAALAAEVRRWAAALGLPRLEAQVAAVGASH